MQAAVLKAFGSKLQIEDVAEPTLGTGEVIVDVAASRVLPYSKEVFSGERRYQLDLPVVLGPGAIGRIHAVGPDATHLEPATGSIAILPSARATICSRPTSPCRA